MILKYDIYVEIKQKITITRLIPKRQRWEVEYPENEYIEIVKYFETIQNGIYNEEYIVWIDEQSEFIRKLNEFLINEYMISKYDSKEFQNDYSHRQIEVFDAWNLNPCHPYEYQKKLEKSVVAVIGAGGVGTAITNSLISCGVGKVILIDGDTIEEGNLARQFLYRKDDIGHKKVEVLSDRLNKRGLGKVIPIDEYVNLRNINEIIECTSVRIDLLTGIPSPNSEFTIHLYKEILKNGVPICSLGEHDLGPIFTSVDDVDYFIKKTSDRFELQRLHNKKRNRQFVIDRHPSYLPEIEMVAGMCTDEIIRYLTGYSITNLLHACYGLDPVERTFKYYML